MKRWLFLVVVSLAACGDDDDGVTPDVDAGVVDAGPQEATLTRYVLDLVENGTSDTAAPRPFGEFADLPDPDGEAGNEAAYAPLFPR